MMKPLVVFGCFVLGLILIAVPLFGVTGVLDSILFISLRPLQESWQWTLGLIASGFVVWFFGGIALRA